MPVEGVGLVVWYIVDEIRDNPGTWWQFSTRSLAMVLTQVGVTSNNGSCNVVKFNDECAPKNVTS